MYGPNADSRVLGIRPVQLLLFIARTSKAQPPRSPQAPGRPCRPARKQVCRASASGMGSCNGRCCCSRLVSGGFVVCFGLAGLRFDVLLRRVVYAIPLARRCLDNSTTVASSSGAGPMPGHRRALMPVHVAQPIGKRLERYAARATMTRAATTVQRFAGKSGLIGSRAGARSAQPTP